MSTTNNSEPQKVTMDLLPLTTAIGNLSTAISGFGNSVSTVKIKLSDGFEGAVKQAVVIAQTQMQGFVQNTVAQMNKEVTKTTFKDGKPVSQTVTTTALDQKIQQSGIAFDQKRLAAINEYNNLVKQQKMTFDDFASAIRKVTDHFMSISDLYAEGDKATDVIGNTKRANVSQEQFVTVASMIKNGGGASDAASQQLAIRVLSLLNSRNSTDPEDIEKFKNNQAIQEAAKHNVEFAKLLKDKNADPAILFKEFVRGIGIAYNDPKTNKVELQKKLDQYVDPNIPLQNLMKGDQETLHGNANGSLNDLYKKSKKFADEYAPTLKGNSETSTTKGQTDDAWRASHAQSAAMSKELLDNLAIWQQKMLKQFPEAVAIVNAVAAFTSGIIKTVEVVMDFKSALAAILGLWGIKKLLGGGSAGPGAGLGGGMGGFGCCCPCGPEPQRAAQGAAGMASSFAASALAAILGGMFVAGGAKPTPEHGMANTASPNQDYKVDPSYHASMGNLGVPYQPPVTKGDIGQLGADAHGMVDKVNSGLEKFNKGFEEVAPYLMIIGGLAMVLATLPVSGPATAAAAAAGVVGIGMTAGAGKANAKESKGNRGVLEHAPPDNVKDLVKPAEINRPSKNLNDSLDGKYQHPETRNRPMASNGMDIEWAKRNQTITQNITNHQIFHMNFNGSILQDPSSLRKNVASAMGNKAMMTGDAINVGARGVIV